MVLSHSESSARVGCCGTVASAMAADMAQELPTIGGPQDFKERAMEDKGETARLYSFVSALAVVDPVKSTLGPKGMDKILKSMGRGKELGNI